MAADDVSHVFFGFVSRWDVPGTHYMITNHKTLPGIIINHKTRIRNKKRELVVRAYDIPSFDGHDAAIVTDGTVDTIKILCSLCARYCEIL